VLGLISGWAALILGGAGVALALFNGFLYRTPAPLFWDYRWSLFDSGLAWIGLSCLLVLLGIRILRDTLIQPSEKPSWFFPLRLFMMIVQARAMSEGRVPVRRGPALIKAAPQGPARNPNPSAGEKENRP